MTEPNMSSVVQLHHAPDSDTHFDTGPGKPTICGIAANVNVRRKRCITTVLNEEIIELALRREEGITCERCRYHLRAALVDWAFGRPE